MAQDAARQLRDTSDEVVRDLDALTALEDEKRQLEPGDPRLVDFATRIEQIANALLERISHQRARVVAADRGDVPTPPQSIEATPPREIHLVLADWRTAERRASEAEPGSPEAVETEQLIERLREEYRRAHEAASGL